MFEKILSSCKQTAQKVIAAVKNFYSEKAVPAVKSFFSEKTVHAVKSFFSEKAVSAVKSFYSDKVKPIFEKIFEKKPQDTDSGSGLLTWLAANKKLIAIIGGSMLLVAVGVFITLMAVNVWSRADVTVNMPYELYVSASDAASGSDIMTLITPQPAVSDSSVSGADTAVSSSDTVSDSDVISVRINVKKGTTVADVLASACITLDEAYMMDRKGDEVIEDDTIINIFKLMYVTITADGTATSIYTDLITVGELLAQQGITLDEDDRLSCAAEDAVYNNMNIIVNRVNVVDEVKTEVIPFETEKRANSSMYVGKEKTTVSGVDGAKEITYRKTYVDGVLESTVIVNEVVTVEPVTRIIEYGTKAKTTRTTKKTSAGRYIVSKEKVYDCDGSGHGYYIITYSDGTVVYQDF